MPKFLLAAKDVFVREQNELLSMLARILQANENFKSKFLKHKVSFVKTKHIWRIISTSLKAKVLQARFVLKVGEYGVRTGIMRTLFDSNQPPPKTALKNHVFREQRKHRFTVHSILISSSGFAQYFQKFYFPSRSRVINCLACLAIWIWRAFIKSYLPNIRHWSGDFQSFRIHCEYNSLALILVAFVKWLAYMPIKFPAETMKVVSRDS